MMMFNSSLGGKSLTRRNSKIGNELFSPDKVSKFLDNEKLNSINFDMFDTFKSKNGPDRTDFECGICANIMCDPCRLPCGHTYCSDCIENLK